MSSQSTSPSGSKRQRGVAIARPNRRERQIVRMLALLRSLGRGSSVSVHELAAEFGTRRETIYRDLRALQDAGFPIAGDENGRLSNPRLLASSNVPSIRFSPAELDALRTAVAQVQVPLPVAGPLAAAAEKLNALLAAEPDGGFRKLGALVDCEGAGGVKDYRLHETSILLLAEAMLRRRRCFVHYRKPSLLRAKRYEFDPYRFLLVDGGLYAVGCVPKHDSVVTLSVDRFEEIVLTNIDFEVSAAFDCARYREQAFGVAADSPETICLRFSAEQAPYVRERLWHPSQVLTDLPDGELEMSFHAGGTYEIRRWILGWGDAVQVLMPTRLRDEIQQVARRTMANYSKN